MYLRESHEWAIKEIKTNNNAYFVIGILISVAVVLSLLVSFIVIYKK